MSTVLEVEGEVRQESPNRATASKPKLTRLMELVGSVSKDKQNDFHHYKYASAKAVLDKVQAGLIELGLYSTPRFSVVGSEGDLITVSVDLAVYDHELGTIPVFLQATNGPREFSHNELTVPLAVVTAFGSGSDKGDKAVMKAQTAALKYAWMTLLNIPTGDDPEADTATDARTTAPVSAPVSKGGTGAIGVAENVKVLEVKKKSEAEKAPWLVITSAGEFQTFDKDVIAQASFAQASGSTTTFKYKETKWGRDIVKEKPVA